jgi:WhiB family redox-sensing transcriptional regulator
MIAVEHQAWTKSAKCRGTGDALFTEGADQRRARVFCTGCPVRAECLAEALDN